MKRFLCLLLTLALLSAGCLPAAFAEEGTEPVFSEAVEAEVPEAVDAGDTGLTVEGVETEAPAEVPEEGLSLTVLPIRVTGTCCAPCRAILKGE